MMDSFRCFILLAASAFVMLSFPITGIAQSFGSAFADMGDNDQPVNIEADRLEIIDKQKTAILTGNVKVIQGTTIVHGREMLVYYLRSEEKEQTKSGIERIEINDGVAIRSREGRATADKAVINLITNEATLTGEVRLSQDGSFVEACSLWVDLETRNTKLNHLCKERISIITNSSNGEDQ